MRLHKYIADAGICSRRKAEEMIREGKVEVNGRSIVDMGFCVDPSCDEVKVEGRLIKQKKSFVYLLLNKPIGYETTCLDMQGKRTVMQLIPEKRRVFPVGRLDRDTEGILLLTDDGDLTFKLTHPRFGVEKTYDARIQGEFGMDKLKVLEGGVFLQGYKTQPAKLKILSQDRMKARVLITLHEGRNRQVKKMFAKVACRVVSLKRVQYGPLRLGELPRGKYRYLTKEEIESLKRETKNQKQIGKMKDEG